MDSASIDGILDRLLTGFEALQDAYQKLQGQHQALEKTLEKQREQFHELRKSSTSSAVTSPPLSLSSSITQRKRGTQEHAPGDAPASERLEPLSKDKNALIEEASGAATVLREALSRRPGQADGVKIWSGRSADDTNPSQPSIPETSQSPLEQDFTIEGVPSKLGCPFASMASKKLSSHAASVLNRYGQNGRSAAAAAAAASPSVSAASRINGRESFANRQGNRPSTLEPGNSELDHESPHSERALKEHVENQEEAGVGMCPIRLLDQRSPEEVATYFEQHKHELPRSHELCVKRYQNSEQQIRKLDAKYGNMVTMIQGLGAKHQNFLPKEPDEELCNDPTEETKSDEKVRKWASGVSEQAAVGEDAAASVDAEDRQPRFERPLREIRVGESPSRPWGISVPAKYLDHVDQVDEKAAAVSSPEPQLPPAGPAATLSKCPFKPAAVSSAKAAFVDPATTTAPPGAERMVFTGPVFIGYSAEDAARILQNNGSRTK